VALLGKGQDAWVQDGMSIRVRAFQGRPLSAQLPEQAVFEVVEAPPSSRAGKSGDTHKMVLLENGKSIRAPHFVTAGERITVNLAEHTYAGKE
jgi:elongation factor P